LVYYLEKGKTIGEYYSKLLTRLDEKIVRKDPDCKRKMSSFIRTMHPSISVFVIGKLRDQHYELLELPPCSPDLAPSDFYLFPKLKLFLAGQRFSSNQEAIAAVEVYFASDSCTKQTT
jgi:histone-lysine N-methyltransferase SETMAR